MYRQSLPESFINAWHGIIWGLRVGRNLRLQLAAFALIILVGIVRSFTVERWAIILVLGAGVLSLELMNTALEVLADRLHPEEHIAIGRAKDMAAGAVLCLSVAAAVVGLLFLVYP